MYYIHLLHQNTQTPAPLLSFKNFEPMAQFVVAMMQADKYLFDRALPNAHWSKLSKIFQLDEINLLERQFLTFLDYRLTVDDSAYQTFISSLSVQYHVHYFPLASPPRPILQVKAENEMEVSIKPEDSLQIDNSTLSISSLSSSEVNEVNEAHEVKPSLESSYLILLHFWSMSIWLHNSIPFVQLFLLLHIEDQRFAKSLSSKHVELLLYSPDKSESK